MVSGGQKALLDKCMTRAVKIELCIMKISNYSKSKHEEKQISFEIFVFLLIESDTYSEVQYLSDF